MTLRAHLRRSIRRGAIGEADAPRRTSTGLWIPINRTLTVLRWTPDGYLTALTADESEVVRAEPFKAIELHVGMLFGEEAEGP